MIDFNSHGVRAESTRIAQAPIIRTERPAIDVRRDLKRSMQRDRKANGTPRPGMTERGVALFVEKWKRERHL